METKPTMPLAEDTREAVRFTQNEQKTVEVVCNAELPEYQREFVRWAWYTRTPVSVLAEHLPVSRGVMNRLFAGTEKDLTPEEIFAVQIATAAMQTAYQQGALPTKDTKAVAGILRLAVTNVKWSHYYQAQQQQQQQPA